MGIAEDAEACTPRRLGMSGQMPRLRRVDCSGPGIARRGRRRGFEYADEDGERIDELEVLERIRELVIPPA